MNLQACVYRIAALALVVCACEVTQAQIPPIIEIFPAAPRYQEPVYARINPRPFDFGFVSRVRARMTGTTIFVEWDRIPELVREGFELERGRFPEGTYTVVADIYTTQFIVGPAPTDDVRVDYPTVPTINYSDVWWTPEEPGTALTITQGPTTLLFAIWCVYDVDGKPTWYTLEPGHWQASGWQTGGFFLNSGTLTGDLHRTTGPYFGGPYDPAKLNSNVVGSGTLTFYDHANASFVYTIDGISGVKQLSRMPVE